MNILVIIKEKKQNIVHIKQHRNKINKKIIQFHSVQSLLSNHSMDNKL